MSLKINAPFVEGILVRFIRDEMAKFGYTKAILGLSGGLDSAVCACLAAKALGPRRVLAMIMPHGAAFPAEVRDAQSVVRLLKIRSQVIDISPQIDAYFKAHPTKSRILRGNKMARERMAVLYDYSAREKALILGTSNKSELLIGYGTIHGDMASAINPLGDLYKTQIRQLAEHLGVPSAIMTKAPTAGLWDGQTDEQEIGLPYRVVDAILEKLVDGRKSLVEIAAAGFKPAAVKKVAALIKNSEFKRKLPPIVKLSHRTVGHDFLYPYDWGK